MPMAPRENVSAGWPHRAELRSCTASGPSLCTHTNGLRDTNASAKECSRTHPPFCTNHKMPFTNLIAASLAAQATV